MSDPDRAAPEIRFLDDPAAPPLGDDSLVPCLGVARTLLQRPGEQARYVAKSALGEGGMGVVSVVRDQDLQRILALKSLKPEHLGNENLVREFVAEARATAQLQHPNIIPVHDIGIEGAPSTPFYTMKLVEGQSLLDIIQRLANGDAECADRFHRFALLSVFRKICDAVAYAHSRGIIHRDIKPENVMVGEFGEVLLLDWGLAKRYSQPERPGESVATASVRVTISEQGVSSTAAGGLIKGSLNYMSPEQALADVDQVDRQTDVFLLGATLYHTITLNPPYAGSDADELIAKAKKGDCPHPRSWPHAEDAPDALVGIILKAMAVSKEERYRSVDEMAQDIDNHMSGRTASAFRAYEPGDVLIKAGDVGDETFVVVSGAVEIRKMIEGNQVVLDRLGKGAIIGELSGLVQDVRSTDAVALERTEVLVISAGMLFDELRKLPPWMEKIVLSLAERVTKLNQAIHPFVKGNCSYPVLKQLYYVFCLLNEKPFGKPTVSVRYKGLVREVAGDLALAPERVGQILDYMLTTDMCEIDEFDRFRIRDMTEFGKLVEYCRGRLQVEWGDVSPADRGEQRPDAAFDAVLSGLVQF